MVVDRVGYAWAALMMAIALLNLIVATTFDFEIWRWFATFGAISIKVVAFAVTYMIFRTMVHRAVGPGTRAVMNVSLRASPGAGNLAQQSHS